MRFLGFVDDIGLLHTEQVEKYKRHLSKLKGKKVKHSVDLLEETISDPYRRYYFKYVMGPIRDYTGASVEAIHHEMKVRYSSKVDEFEIRHIQSVWSNKSTITIPDKKAFILNVRNWADEFLGVTTPEFEPRSR